jgi:hypothetical protein
LEEAAMGKHEKVRITCQQGNALLMASAGFILPEKLGETTYNVADRSLAEQDVGMLYRELKSRSPILQKDRKICFGPTENWKKPSGDPNVGREMKDVELEVNITLSEDARSGAFWCLIAMLHPGSQGRLPASSQVEVAWPLAERLRLKKMLRKDIGLETAVPRRLDLDDTEEEAQKEVSVEQVEAEKKKEKVGVEKVEEKKVEEKVKVK